MKSTKIMIILYSIIALFAFVYVFENDIHQLKGDLFYLAFFGPITPIIVCVIIAVIEKMRINIADKTEKKAFFIAKILSNILFLRFYFIWLLYMAISTLFLETDGSA